MNWIATVGPNIPQDLLLAVEGYCGPLTWRLDRPTPRADSWLESRFAPWARSIVEDWAEGALDEIDRVIFSRAEDNAQRLYYYLCELRARGVLAGPEPVIFDVALVERVSSLDRTIASVRQLAGSLGLDAAALEQGIARANALRAAPVAGSGGPVCLLAGTPPPDRRLHHMIEGQGWSAVGETLDEQWRRLGPEVAASSGDPAAAIARQLHGQAVGPRSWSDPAAELLARASRLRARAAVLWFTEEDEALMWRLPSMRRGLEGVGLPVLPLTRRSWRADDGVAGEIAEFLEGIAP